jgi:hypothetical protein
MEILANHAESSDFSALRNNLQNYLNSNLGANHYKTLKDAFNNMFLQGLISSDERDMVRELSLKDDKHLLAIWESYRQMLDEDEFVDSIQVLCDVKRKSNSHQRSTPQIQKSEGGFGGFNLMGGGFRNNEPEQVISDKPDSVNENRNQPLNELHFGNQQENQNN